MNTPQLETPRLILRKFTGEDIEALYLILKDEEVNTFLPWYPLKSIGEARVFFEKRYGADYTKPQAYAYAICLKSDNYPIGYIKVDMDESHDFGYGLRKEFWHQGIVTEAGKADVYKRQIMDCAKAKYEVSESGASEQMTQLIQERLADQSLISDFDYDLFSSITEKILIQSNASVHLQLRNGKVI